MKKILPLIALITLCSCSLQYIIKRSFKPVDTSKIQYIIDDENRIVNYHGLNISNTAKHDSLYQPWQNYNDFRRMTAWGFNFARYLVFWNAIEPVQGQIDTVYLRRAFSRIKWLGQLGVDVVIDVHQDLYNQKFTGNGFPDWTVRDDSLPFDPQEPWASNYKEPPVLASYTNFWSNDSLKSAYIAVLCTLFNRCESVPNIIGIDIMNEPFPGLTVGFEMMTLSAFYTSVDSMVVANGFTKRIFFEPVIYTSTGVPSALQYDPNSPAVYFPHYYDQLSQLSKNKEFTAKNSQLLRWSLGIKANEAQSFKTPLLIGEFGISPNIKGYETYLNNFIVECDRYGIGWSYWSYDKSGYGFLNPDGTEKENLKYLVRVYAQRIAGRNPYMSTELDSAGGIFNLSYDLMINRNPTLIFIPNYKNVEITVNGKSGAYTGSIFRHYNSGEKVQKIRITWEN